LLMMSWPAVIPRLSISGLTPWKLFKKAGDIWF